MIVSEIVALTALWTLQAPARPPAIVFVCEHGAAKSVIATAYFNKLAPERRCWTTRCYANLMTALNNRTHIFARPSAKERLIWCFGTLFGCGEPATFSPPGLSEPILAFRFPRGGSLSVEFTDDAPDDDHARRGAWLEIATADPGGLQRAVVDAGLPQIHYAATNRFYFQAPGGQVFGIVPADGSIN